jgi:hypothetical protein
VRLLVYMRDGRTVYRLQGRAALARLVSKEPWHEEPGVLVDRGTWNPTTGEYVWLAQLRVRFISKGSIASVEEDSRQAGAP